MKLKKESRRARRKKNYKSQSVNTKNLRHTGGHLGL